MRAASLLLMLVALAAAQDQTGNNGAGSIRGTVVDSVTHQPLREASVSLSGHPGQNQVTDAAGAFEINNLQPGQYSLDVEHREYPQASPRNIAIKAGEQAAPIIVELVPFAAVSGRVLDEDGDPLPACSVHLQLARPPYQEVIAMQDFREVLGSSEDGEYRLDRVPAGKYILRAQCQAPVFEPRPLSAGPDPLPTSAYPPQFYPAASSAELAEAIELAPGRERSGLDFRMKPSHVTHIHVRLSGVSWRGRKDLAWQLLPAAHRAPAMPLDGSLHFDWLSVWHQIETTNGEFEIPKVFPGSYRLLVSSNMRFTAGGAMIGGARQIDVGDQPIEVEVALRPAVDLNGTIEIVGASGANRVGPDQVSVELVVEYPNFFRSVASQAKDDGTFTIKSAFPGPARIKISASERCGVHCAQDAVFLKSAWFGAAEVTDGVLDLSSGASGDLRIVVTTDFAAIQGTAPAFAVVTASAEDTRGFSMYELNAPADQNGQFKFDHLTPGRYRLGLLGQLASDGGSSSQEVTLQEGQMLTVELKANGGAR
jgi:Carboxypeptidase regulatory-like domain